MRPGSNPGSPANRLPLLVKFLLICYSESLMKRLIICLFLITTLFLAGCISPPDASAPTPDSASPTIPDTKPSPRPPGPKGKTTPQAANTNSTAEIQTVLNLGIMVHLEGWDDGTNQEKFRKHADLLREYADLFEKYGAKLTLESKEMTLGAIKWNDNILLEMEKRGHGIGVHADVGGSKKDTLPKMKKELETMKSQLESLGVTVRHVSGVCSHCDWVTATADSGYEFVTGTVAYALLSLPDEDRPIEIPDSARPAQYHQAYPFTTEGRLHSWRAENGSNWIDDNPKGRIVIIPSGEGLAFSYEESKGEAEIGGSQNLTIEDINAFERELKDILKFIESDKSTQPYTYYLSWSLGKALDKQLMEKWLQMVAGYVDSGKVKWQTIPEMYDDYLAWEHATGRR